MPKFKRSEVEEAFARYYEIGPVLEQWDKWVEVFTPDCYYEDHFWGPLHGHKEVDLWIHAVMKGVPEVYTVLDWWAIDDDKVTFKMQNRRDNPDPNEGPPYWDFPGLSVIWYAGDGLWREEEDYWDAKGARATTADYNAACERVNAFTVETRMLRNHWPEGVADFARTDQAPNPSWIGMDDVPAIQKARQWHELLATIRD